MSGIQRTRGWYRTAMEVNGVIRGGHISPEENRVLNESVTWQRQYTGQFSNIYNVRVACFQLRRKYIKSLYLRLLSICFCGEKWRMYIQFDGEFNLRGWISFFIHFDFCLDVHSVWFESFNDELQCRTTHGMTFENNPRYISFLF